MSVCDLDYTPAGSGINTMFRDADGKLLVAVDDSNGLSVARHFADGKVDLESGFNGIATEATNFTSAKTEVVGEQPDGGILVGGSIDNGSAMSLQHGFVRNGVDDFDDYLIHSKKSCQSCFLVDFGGQR